MPDPFVSHGPSLLRIAEYVALLLFVAAGAPAVVQRWRLRWAAIVVYLAALALAGFAILRWLISGSAGSG